MYMYTYMYMYMYMYMYTYVYVCVYNIYIYIYIHTLHAPLFLPNNGAVFQAFPLRLIHLRPWHGLCQSASSKRASLPDHFAPVRRT